MELDGGLPSHLQHFELHLTDVFNMLQRILADVVHRLTDILEVVAYLLEEPGPLLLSGHLRDHLHHCQQRIMLNVTIITLVGVRYALRVRGQERVLAGSYELPGLLQVGQVRTGDMKMRWTEV